MRELRITDLSIKEVIDLDSGQKLGHIRDAVIDPDSGRILAFIIPGKLRWLGLLGREEDVVIPWERVSRTGEDILFVASPKNSGKT